MNIKTSFGILLFASLCVTSLWGQNSTNKATPAALELPAKRVTSPIKVDGIPDDEAWKTAPVMTDLIEFRPTVGRKENPETKTITYLLYDDEGIYFGGKCFERTKDSIAKELVGRDGFGTNDYIGLVFDTYNDKQNGFEYFVTPLGEQWDAKMTSDGEDFSWNAVWKSGAVIHNDGWTFEMFIPYSAIRFGKADVQTWGLNITRRRRKTEQQSTWNPIDPNVNGFLTQEGKWVGISNIKPPLRLQFSPYLSTNVNHYPNSDPAKKDWTSSINGGMDIKYGINQAFTLDATLIPDFGQVQSDNIVYNLTPFEVRYQENRPFFTEGLELFSKGNLLYTRRIGKQSLAPHSVGEYMQGNESIKENPRESKLINATKISGRTQKGLGVGLFNAVTNNRYAILEKNSDGSQRKVLIDPLTNYNILVLDQTLKNNSSISLINLNTWRSGQEYDANVTAGLFSFNDKKNMWNVNGKLATSNLFGYEGKGKTTTGYSHSLGFGKISGRFNFQVGQDLTDDKFNNNDLGYFTFGNTLDHYAWVGYRWTEPKKLYNNIRLNFNAQYSRQLSPFLYRSANFNINTNSQLKNLWFAGALIGYEPLYYDFFEARVPGYIAPMWSDYFVDFWFETNNAKKYKLYAEWMHVDRSKFNSQRENISIGNRYRFSDKLSVDHNINYAPQKRNFGFAGILGGVPVFGIRDIENISNTLSVKYSFNAKMNINLRLRHYWFEVDYAPEGFTKYSPTAFYVLNMNRTYTSTSLFTTNVDQNYNAFNLDAVYTWEFAPGSFINVVWKNFVDDFNTTVSRGYFKNFDSTMQTEENNNLSLKIIYFLDYLQLKGKKKNSK
jgi:hypothetical protein